MSPASILFGACAAGYVAVAIVALLPRAPGSSSVALAAASLVAAAWAALVAINPQPSLSGPAAALDFLRVAAWFVLVLVLARRTHRARPRWWTSGWVGVSFVALAVLGAIIAWRSFAVIGAPSLVSLGIDARLAFAVALLLLVENLYRNAPEEVRWHINLTCIAVAGLYVYEVAYWADTVLYREFSPLLFIGQASVNLLVMPPLVLAARRQRRWKEDVGVSRSVVFHTATLVLAGVFLVGLAAAGEVFRHFGPEWGTLAEASLLFGGCVAIAVFLTSGSARSRLRGLVVDHFFTHRFDYRREWMRCIATLSAVHPHLDLGKRVIRAVADVVDSSGGVLFLRDRAGGDGPPVFRTAGNWNATALEGEVVKAGDPLLQCFRTGDWVAVADRGAPWFPRLGTAWLAVPLPAAGGPAGFVVLLPPRATFRLDQEVFDLLRIIGREVAVFLAEQRATEALVQARQFAEAGQRFAFVAHDIKNVASQLSLLVANAEHHLDNPDFRTDMLATLKGSVRKITALLERLQGPKPRGAQPLRALRPRLEATVRSYRGLGPVSVTLECNVADGAVAMDEAAFDAVMRHLIDNAIEATLGRGAVKVHLFATEGGFVITVADRGRGMAEQFVRDALFRPFTSTKPAGFGLGAFEARELLREAGGELTVASRLGEGTTMRISLPRKVPALPIALRA